MHQQESNYAEVEGVIRPKKSDVDPPEVPCRKDLLNTAHIGYNRKEMASAVVDELLSQLGGA